MAMELDEAARTEKEERRLLAVLALLRGKPAAQVCQQYSICRAVLQKLFWDAKGRQTLFATLRPERDSRQTLSAPANHFRLIF